MAKRTHLTPSQQQALVEQHPAKAAARLDAHARALARDPLPGNRAIGKALAQQAKLLRGEESDRPRPL